jgi:single-strand DNA-binding protein
MIKLQIIGNLGQDAEVRSVNGKQVINFSIAHTESYKDAQGVKQQKTTWVGANYWTDRTAVAQYLKKGTQVYVEGTPEVRTYDGQRGTQAELRLRVMSVQLLGSKDGPRSQNDSVHENVNSSASVNTGSDISPEPVDDLPF